MTVVPFALVAGAVAVVGVLLAVVRRLLPDNPQRPHQEAADAVLSIVGVLYAVILGFVVIVVWENHNQARANSQVEASAVARVYFTARSLPEPQRLALMNHARDYADTVAHTEWPLMASGRTSAEARQHVAELRLTTHQLRPERADQEILMADTLEAIDALVEARRERTSALTAPLSPLMWSGLVAGSALTVGFTFLLNRPGYPMHLFLAGGTAGMITFVLWLVHDLSLPFTGIGAVGPDAFDHVLQRFREFPPELPS